MCAGFRASELASLTADSFTFAAGSATVTLAAAFAKNKRTAIQPLPADVSGVLRDYVASKPAAQPVWAGGWVDNAAEMLHADLDAAGVPYVIDGPDGPLYADFHALRHSYITYLDRGGVSLRTAQEMARHSTPV